MNDHHLKLGRLVDYLTGQTLDDTHDERYRQKIARLLVTAKGYPKTDIHSGRRVTVNVGNRQAMVPVTFVVTVDGGAAMLVQYGPGSLVTRHRPALALARLLAPHQIPLVVVTNGEDADILAGATGRLLDTGLDNIPTREALGRLLADHHRLPINEATAAREARIVMAYEVDDRCPCDTDVCSTSH